MNLQETGHLLGLIAVYNDNFASGLNTEQKHQKAVAWHELLNDYTYADCVAAVKDYYATAETPWIMPADIIRRVHDIQDQRLQKFGGFMPLNPADEYGPDGNLAPDYHQKIKALHQLAKHGQITPAQYAAYQAEKLTLTQLHHQAKEITQ